MIRVTEANIALNEMRDLPGPIWFIGKIPTATALEL